MKNMKLIITTITTTMLTLTFLGCAHTAEKKVDNEVAQEKTVKSQSDLRAETANLIETAPGLTADQRLKLTQLRDSTRTKIDDLWSQSLKIRSVLIKDVITTKYNEAEVERLKQRIRDVEDKRLAVTFSAVESAKNILGHGDMTKYQSMMNNFFDGHGHE